MIAIHIIYLEFHRVIRELLIEHFKRIGQFNQNSRQEMLTDIIKWTIVAALLAMSLPHHYDAPDGKYNFQYNLNQ